MFCIDHSLAISVPNIEWDLCYAVKVNEKYNLMKILFLFMRLVFEI